MMNGLDLFAGIGGMSLALAPWVRPIAYCDNDRYAQAVLLSRMARSELPVAPIWDDVRSLKGSMVASVDIIYAGFPCTDISVAGRGAGLAGKQSGLFVHVARLAEEVRPTFVFLENVPAIRTRGLSVVAYELARLGFDIRWSTVSAAAVGAPHLRKRWFCLATHPERIKLWVESGRSCGPDGEESPESRDDGAYRTVSDAQSVGGDQRTRRNRKSKGQPKNAFPDAWRTIEPTLRGSDHGIFARVDRIRALGNAVCPQAARKAFEKLMGFEK